MGTFLATHRLRHGELTVLAHVLEVSTRTLRTWKNRAGKGGLPGRPPHAQEARLQARAHTAGILSTLVRGHDGWRSVCERLAREREDVPVRLVQESVRVLKHEAREREERRIAEARVHVDVLLRDAVWALDQTHVLRDEQGELKALAVRECLMPRTLGLSFGPPACGLDVVRLLEQTAKERGGWPFVLQLDNGPENRNAEVMACLRRARVIALWNVPHTPQHNPRIERTFASLKRASGLGKHRSAGADPSRGPVRASEPGVFVTRTMVCVRLLTAWKHLDEETPRTELAGMTPAELDNIAPRAEDHARRACFYSEVCLELERIALAPQNARDRRKQEREAIWAVLERHGLATRTRGGRSIPTVKAEGLS